MTYCEDCQYFKMHFFEDRAVCLLKQKPAEATDESCKQYLPPDEQIGLEG